MPITRRSSTLRFSTRRFDATRNALDSLQTTMRQTADGAVSEDEVRTAIVYNGFRPAFGGEWGRIARSNMPFCGARFPRSLAKRPRLLACFTHQQLERYSSELHNASQTHAFELPDCKPMQLKETRDGSGRARITGPPATGGWLLVGPQATKVLNEDEPPNA